MRRVGLAIAMGVSYVLLASSCSTFNGEADKDAGGGVPPPSEEGGVDGGASADASKIDSGPEKDAGTDAGRVELDICARGVCRHVFVTAEKFTGNFLGVEGADTQCNAAAIKNVALGGRNFKAWLSEPAKNASTRIVHDSAIPYKRLDGRTVAIDWNGLTDAKLDAPINIDQFGSVVASDVWTGTDTAGDATTSNCNGWRSQLDSGIAMGQIGRSAETNKDWTAANPSVTCAQLARLYCIEE